MEVLRCVNCVLIFVIKLACINLELVLVIVMIICRCEMFQAYDCMFMLRSSGIFLCMTKFGLPSRCMRKLCASQVRCQYLCKINLQYS